MWLILLFFGASEQTQGLGSAIELHPNAVSAIGQVFAACQDGCTMSAIL